jgi:dolichol kinase
MFTRGVAIAALPIATREVSSELHALLRKIDPATFRDELEDEARAQLARIISSVQTLYARTETAAPGSTTATLRQKLIELRTALERAQDMDAASARAFWAELQREVHPAYESLVAWLRSSSMQAPSLRPTNYARNLFHVGAALLALLLLVLAPSQIFIIIAAAVFFCAAWTMEISRRFSPALNERLMRLFGRVAHPHERFRVNSSTWYATALVLLSLWATPAVSSIAVAVLGIGDPIAALVGRRFGRTRLRAGRSLQGSLGFVVAGSLAALAVACAMIPGFMPLRLLVAGIAGVTGAVVEVFSTQVDDNLTIPLAVAASVTGALALMGAG